MSTKQALSAHPVTMDVFSCGIHGFGEVIGIDVDEIRVFWKLKFEDELAQQKAYRVRVSEHKDVVSQESNDYAFDTGRIESSAQRNILCKPQGGFKSTTFYHWVVTIWDQDANEATSAVQEFFVSYPRCSRLLPPYSMNQTYVSGRPIMRSSLPNDGTNCDYADATHQSDLSHMVRRRGESVESGLDWRWRRQADLSSQGHHLAKAPDSSCCSRIWPWSLQSLGQRQSGITTRSRSRLDELP